jgi:hypothetical protein
MLDSIAYDIINWGSTMKIQNSSLSRFILFNAYYAMFDGSALVFDHRNEVTG